MKKLYFLLTFFVLVSMSCMGQVIFSESFEDDESFFQNWWFIDEDGDDYDWHLVSGPSGVIAQDGSSCAISYSFDYYEGPLAPDNWMISSPIYLSGFSTLSFWVNSDQTLPGEHYAVYICPYNSEFDLQDFEVLIPESVATGQYENITVNIPSSYFGKSVFIAFRHFNTVGQNYLVIDNVTVTVTQSFEDINTLSVSDLTPVSATVNALFDQSAMPFMGNSEEGIMLGIAWTTDPSFTVMNTRSLFVDGYGIWPYSLLASELLPETTYYVRAYYDFTYYDETLERNNHMTVYGNVLSFTTPVCTSESEDYVSVCDEYSVSVSTMLLHEGFNDGILPAGWSIVDADGDGQSWVYKTDIPHTGTSCISSASYNNAVLFPENWLITSAVTVPDTGVTTLSWWVAPQDESWGAEHYGVYVSTTSNAVADFNGEAIFAETLSGAGWRQHSMSLNDYAGDTIYLAFVHENCSDQYWLNLDDIEVVNVNVADVLTQSGVYNLTYTNQYGCDSLVTLHLSVSDDPVVTTLQVMNVTSVSAAMGAQLLMYCEGEEPMLGVCYGVNPNPTIADSCYIGGAQDGELWHEFEWLEANTTYYVRALAITNTDTVYGPQVSFTTYGYINMNVTVVSENTNLPIAGASVYMYYGEYVDNHYYRTNMIAEGMTDASGIFSVGNLVMSSSPEILFVTVYAEGYYDRTYIYTDAYAGTLNRTVSMPPTPCYQIPYEVYWQEENGEYVLTWWSDLENMAGPKGKGDFDNPDDPNNSEVLAYSYIVLENGVPIADSLTTPAYIIPSFNSQSCYQVLSVCPNGAISDTSVCAVIHPVLPTVVTASVDDVTSTTALVSGEITFNGYDEIYSNGFVYSTIPSLDSGGLHYRYINNDSLFSAEISGLQPETTYYVWAIAINSMGISYGNMLSFTTTRECHAPLSFSVSDVLATSAVLTWQDDNDDEQLFFELSYKADEDASWTVIPNLTSNYYMLSGLQQNTSYTARIRTYCDVDAHSPYSIISFRTNCVGGSSETLIGNTTSTSDGAYLPLNTFYNYSYSQQIYPADEIGSARTINVIYLQYFYTSSITRKLDIYMGHTTKNYFSSGSDWVPANELTLVDSCVFVTFSPNNNTGYWVAIPLSTPFEYNGTDNLVIAVDDNTGSYTSSGEKFYTHYAGNYTSLYVCSDGTNYNPFSPTNGTKDVYRNNLRIPGICNTEGCDRSNVYVSNLTDSSATIAIAPGSGVQGYELEYKLENDNAYTSIPAQGTSYTITGLSSNTNYELRIRSVCDGGEYSDWKTVNFTTPVKNYDRLYVTANGTGDGSSWLNATNDLVWALNTASMVNQTYGSMPEIWVAEGVYYGNVENNVAFLIEDGSKLYGGFAGNENSLEERNIQAHPTILDGQNSRQVLNQNSNGSDNLVIIDGFTIRNGYVSGSGGGANIGLAEVRNCRFENNTCTSSGGAVFVRIISRSNGYNFRDCEFVGNTASYRGGAVCAVNNSVSFINCKISGNTASNNGGGVSGGCKMVNCEISNNTAGYCSGVYDLSDTIVNCDIVGNVSLYSGNAGLSDFNGVMINTVVWGNTYAGTSANLKNCNNMTAFNSAIEGLDGNNGVINLSSDNFGSDPNVNYPFFVSSENGDYRLRIGSALIDAGMANDYLGSYDMAGESRVYGDAVEIGCYEFHNEEYCLKPIDLAARDVMSSSALIMWRDGGNVTELSYYELSYKTEDATEWTVLPEELQGTYRMLASLQPSTNYMVRMRSFCNNGQTSEYTSELVFTTSPSQSSIACAFEGNTSAIINGPSNLTNYAGNLPSNFYYKYGYSQQIYLASEIGGGGLITSLALQYFYSSNQTRTMDIYLGHTTKSSFSSNYDWVPLEDLTLVYSGTITFNRNGSNYWYNITLQNEFEYNGIDNLVLVVDDNNGSYTNSSNKFYTNQSTAGNLTLYVYSDGTNYNPANPSFSGTLAEYRNNLKLNGQCIVNPDCERSNLVVMNVTENSAKLVYAQDSSALGIELQYGIAGSDNYETLQASGGEYVLTGLRYNTTYEARIRTICDGNIQSSWKTVTFTTSLINLDKLYVTNTGTGDASSWENATDDLAWATNTAARIKEVYGTNVVVWVAEGTYYGANGENAFTMTDGINVYGGFAGTETELSQRDINAHPTILDGQNNKRVLNQSVSFNTKTVWDGFVIQNGNVTSFSSTSNNNCGGGAFLRARGGLRNCRIINNAAYNGGGVYSYASSSYPCTLEACTVSHNTASNDAAGVYVYYMSLSKCVVSHNRSTNTSSGYGGGVYVGYANSSRDIISNCLIANNTSAYAAGVYLNSGTKILNSTIVRNKNSSTSMGAGVYGYSTATIVNSIVWGNRNVNGEANLGGNYDCQYSAADGAYAGTNFVALSSESNGNSLYYPNFVNPSQVAGSGDETANVDWHIGEGSVCINRGNNAALGVADSVDMDGNDRIQVQTVDLGCFESAYDGITLPEYNGIIYVAENGTGSGTSWNDAMSSLSDALSLAFIHNADVWVAEGTYYGDSISASAFTVVEGVNVYGGFIGNEPANYDLSLRDVKAHVSILDGQHNQRLLFQNTDFTVTHTVWDGFTLQNGRAHTVSNGSNDRAYGGAAYLKLGFTLRNCVITNNAAVYGGGIYVYYYNYNTTDTTFLINCTISHNSSTYNGGGAYLYKNVVADGCSFEYNSSRSSGGGIYMNNQVLLTNCLIANNTTYNNSGAGVYSSSSNNTVRNSTIVNNEISRGSSTGSSSYHGAGINGYYATITNCIVWGNKNYGMPNGIEGSYFTTSYVASDIPCEGTNNIVLSLENDEQNCLSPHFVNPSLMAGIADVTDSVDWHLQQGSPCINRGDNSVADIHDFDGNARVQMDTIDLGCYESPYYGVVMPNYNGIVYVKENGAGNRSGDSWENAMSSIPSAMNVAIVNDAVVWVAAGTYYGDGTSENAFVMQEGVNVYGGFAGTEDADYDLNLRDFETNTSVLDGQYTQRVLVQKDHFSANTAAVWDGFTIQNGQVQGNGAGAYIRAFGTLSNCVVKNNVIVNPNGQSNSFFGAGVYAYGGGNNSRSVINNCVIANNSFENVSYGYGSGLYTCYTDVRRTEISHNTSPGYGGGVYTNGYTDFSNCLIYGNTSAYYGGGVYISSSNVNFVNCDIVSNTVNTNGYVGGGIYGSYSVNNITLTNSIVWGNKVVYSLNNIELYSISVSYSAVEGGYSGEGNILLASSNDGLDMSQNYVRFTDPQNGNFQLHPTSDCINIGNNEFVTDSLDLYGNQRIFGLTVDMGCSEGQEESNCTSAMNLTASNITTNSAQLSWQPTGTENQWLVVYSEVNSGTTNNLIVNEYPTCTLEGLSFNRQYTATVRSICGENETSILSIPVSFQTTCDPNALDSLSDFTVMVPADGDIIYNRQVSFNWSVLENASSYDFYLWPSSASEPTTPTRSGLVVPYVVYNLPDYEPGATYNWKVVAWNECLSKTSAVATIQANWNPDLHVSAISTSTPMSTQSMTVTWTVTNDGLGNTPPGSTWYDYIWLTPVDGIGDGFWYNVSEVKLATVPSLNVLNSGESYTNSVEVTIPEDYVGSYYLFVLADQPNVRDINYDPTGNNYAPNPYTPDASGYPYPYLSGTVFNFSSNGVVEVNESDNFFYKVITILPPPSPDLVVSSVTHGGTAISGMETNLTWTVENRGQAAAMNSWIDVIYLSSDTILDTENDIRLGRFVHDGTLAINESYQRTAQFTIPVECSGSYYFIVVTDNNNTVYEGLQEHNNKGISSPMEITLTWFTDLQVTSVTMPNEVDANGTYTCHYMVTNMGASPTYVNRWEDAVYISRYTPLNRTNAIKLSSVTHTSVLAADASYENNITVRFPENISGSWYLYVVTDVDNDVFEYNADDNNTYAYQPALTVLLPDLRVTNVVMPDEIDPNVPVQVQWTVTNEGLGGMHNGSFRDKFLFHGISIYQANVRNINMPAGGSMTRTATIQLPCVSAQTDVLRFSVDEGGSVFEANEENNITTVNLNFVTPNLTVGEVIPVMGDADTNSHLWSGTPAELSYTIINTGAAPINSQNVTDEIYFSTSANSYQASDLIYTHTHALDLGIGDSETYTCSLVIPNGISGTYYYHVVCNADAHVCEGGNLGNNEAVSVPVEVLLSPSPDLVISSLVAPAQAYLGTGVTLTYTIANQGTGALNNTRVMQKFYYSMSPTSYDTLKLLFTNYDYLNLGVNESVSNTVTVTMPINVVSGNYYIHAFVDANNQVYEHEGEHNNKAVSNMIATSVYQLDLRLTQIEGPDVMQWGETATFILHIQNNSALPTLSSSWQDVLYLSSDDVLHATDQLMQSMTHRSVVEPGASYEVPIRVTIPLGAPSASYLIGVTDYNLNNPDINISNNVLIKTLTVNSIPTPDISIGEVEVLDDIVSGQQARIAYKVTNVGDIAIAQGNWNDKLFVSLNNNYDNSDVELRTKNQRNVNLASGDFYRDTLSFVVPLPYSGNLYLLMKANVNNTPYDANQENNTAVVPVIVILPVPGDLVVTDVTCENTIVSGQTLHAEWTVQNIGDYAVSGNGLRSLVYVSTDTAFDANDRLLGSVTTNTVNLDVDATLQQNLETRVSGLSAGNYYLIVKTDVTNAFNEVNDNNNTAYSIDPFAVTIRPLPFNENVYDTLRNNEVSDYMLNVGDNVNQTVRIHLTSEDSLMGAVNMIYATYNAMGDNLNYSYSTIGQYQANSELYIPATQPGFYGVNIYGSTPVDHAQNTIVRADILPFELMGVNDNHGGNTGMVTVELTGSRFRPDMIVTMRRGNEVITADSIIYVNYYQVFAQFDLTGHTPGIYDVSAVNFCEGEAVLANGFTIEEGQPSGLSYNMLFPSSPRPNRNIVMMLEFGNVGNVDLHDQVLEISSIGGCPIALTPDGITLHQTVLRVPLSIEGEPQGLLRPGSYGTLNIYGFTSGALIFTIKPVQE